MRCLHGDFFISTSVYTISIYLYTMKMLSLKLDEDIFRETEKLTAQLKKPRNRYINEALNLYNKYNERLLLKKQLHKDSKLVASESMKVLNEFDKLIDSVE